MCFDAYDTNGDQVIDKKEFYQIIQASMRVSLPKETIQKIVDDTFEEMDTEADGVLTFDEFKAAVMRRKITVDAFWTRKLK